VPPDENPYVGPRPFETADADFFFGRDREIAELVALIVSNQVVLLYAASGAGKSSVLNAAVIGRLERDQEFEMLPVLRIRGQRRVELPGQTNVYSAALLSQIAPPEEESTSLRAALRAREHRDARDGLPAPRALVIDQAEELFTVYPERWSERPAFFEDLAAALRDDPLLRVVISIREDFVAQLDPYAKLLPEGFRARYRLERLGPGAALHAARMPARRAGKPFADGVAERLVADLQTAHVETDHGPEEVLGEFVEPVQLQVACQTLWDALPESTTEITQEHRARFGNVDEVLRQFYDQAIRAAATAARMPESRLRARFGKTFVTPMGTRGTVYWTREETGGIPAAAIEELDARHLIRAELRAGARWYELTHDRLIDPIRASNREHDTRRRDRRLRAVGVAALVGVAGTAAGLATALTGGSSTSVANSIVTHANAQAAAAKAVAKQAFAHATELQHELVRANALVVHIPAGVGPIGSVAFSRGGRGLLVVGAAGRRELSPDGGKGFAGAVAPTAALTAQPFAIAIRGTSWLIAFPKGRLELWRGSAVRMLVPKGPPITSIALSRSGRYAAFADARGRIHVLDTQTAGALVYEPPPNAAFDTPTFGRDQGHVLFAGSDGTVRRGSTSKHELGPVPGLSTERPVGIASSANGRILAAYGGAASTIALLNPAGEILGTLPGTGVVAVALSPAGDRLATAHRDGSIRIWRTLPDLAISSAHLSGDGSRAYVDASVSNLGPSNSGAAVLRASNATVELPALEPGAVKRYHFAVESPRNLPVTLTLASSDTPEQTLINNERYLALRTDIRARIVAAALTGALRRREIRYVPIPPADVEGIRDLVRLPNVPVTASTSGFATWCYWQAGARDPNRHGYTRAWSGWLVQYGRRTAQPRPGDLVFFPHRVGPVSSWLTAVYVGGGRVVRWTGQLSVVSLSRGRGVEIRTYDLRPRRGAAS
jgi:hypothetical protein